MYGRLEANMRQFGTEFKITKFVPDHPENLCAYR